MRVQLEEVRETFKNSGNKGTGAEVILRDFVRSYLPRRFEIGHGEIIDSQGRRSKQSDLVIVTDDHPFSFTADQPGLFFVEGVFAVGEIKSVLTSDEFTDAMEKAGKFRELKPAAPGFKLIWGGNKSDGKRFASDGAPYFLFAFESQLTIETIFHRLKAQTKRSLDAVFILDRGTLIDNGDGEGFLKQGNPDGVTVKGWASLENSSTLACFLLWLSMMPYVRHSGSILPNYLLAAAHKPGP